MQSAQPQVALSDEQILLKAAQILAQRQEDEAFMRKRRVQDWYARYARPEAGHTHQLSTPRKLPPEEAVLLFALERNGYTVQGEAPNLKQGGKWHGHAECRWHLRDMVISQFAPDRLTLLWSLWEGVSGRTNLTEEDLQGALRRQHTRQLQKELQEQTARSKPTPPEA